MSVRGGQKDYLKVDMKTPQGKKKKKKKKKKYDPASKPGIPTFKGIRPSKSTAITDDTKQHALLVSLLFREFGCHQFPVL